MRLLVRWWRPLAGVDKHWQETTSAKYGENSVLCAEQEIA